MKRFGGFGVGGIRQARLKQRATGKTHTMGRPQQQQSPTTTNNSSSPASHSDEFTDNDEQLPTSVTTVEQLQDLPEECLSGDDVHRRPLRHVDEDGIVTTYALNPMTYSVIFILMVELLERFSFYGMNYTQTAYLTGSYNDDWNADMTAIEASTYVAISVGVAYSTPFLGAFLADSVLGDFRTLLLGSLAFYLPGLIIIALTAIPGLLGTKFNSTALQFGFLGLWPVGTGIVKAIVNVFGAKQFHPLLQSSLIESYYVSFYMCINIGALVGGVLVPVLAETNVTAAYFLPVVMLGCAVLCFLIGTPRYVITKAKGKNFCNYNKKSSNNNKYTATVDSKKLNLWTIWLISMLVVPFNIAYAQMSTTFIIQGTVMEKLWFIDASCMNNADSVSVLLFGYIIGHHLYPALTNRGMKLATTHKFAIGSLLGSLAIGWALLVDYRIHATHATTPGTKVSVLWQAPSYILIGIGEIFAVSCAYEVAFSAAPPEQKALASATNLFCIGSLPNFFCIILYRTCSTWFLNSKGRATLHHLQDYTEAAVWKYFMVLFLISLLGVLLNLTAMARNFVESVEEAAAEVIKTPKFLRRPTKLKRMDSWDFSDVNNDEISPLLRAKRHQAYLKFGTGPVLNRNSSMRAGPSLSQQSISTKSLSLKKSSIAKLYNSSDLISLHPQQQQPPADRIDVVMSPSGRPLQAGSFGEGLHRENNAAALLPMVRSSSNPTLELYH